MSTADAFDEQAHTATKGRKPSRWLRKTKLCVYNLQKNCSLGSNCLFAHSLDELQDGPDLYKTQLCTRFIETGHCDDAYCTFAHGQQELQPFPALKQKLCKWHRKGKCRNGDSCSFAHGRQDLRAGDEGDEQAATPPPPAPAPAARPVPRRPVPPVPSAPKSLNLQETVAPPTLMQAVPYAVPIPVPVATVTMSNAAPILITDAMAMPPQPTVVSYSQRTPLKRHAIPYVPLSMGQTQCTDQTQSMGLRLDQTQSMGQAHTMESCWEVLQQALVIPQKPCDLDDSDKMSTSAETAGYLSD